MTGSAGEQDLIGLALNNQIAIADERGLADERAKGRPQRLIVIARGVTHNPRAFVADTLFEHTNAVPMVFVNEKWRMRDVDDLDGHDALAFGICEGIEDFKEVLLALV